MDIKAAIERELAALGDDPGKIAERLLADGDKGQRGVPCDCPVANRLRRKLDDCDISVSQTFATCWAGDGSGYIARLPSPVVDFIRNFDRRMYPDLIV